MPTPQILVVEDEGLVARDIQRSLTRWGYAVPAVVPSGEEAVQKAEELQPDLVLMDIRLKGPMSGIEAGEQVRNRLDVPVVFLTAYADDATLARAKAVEPFGYLVKPFEERELRATVEMALHKHRLESFLRDNESWLASILEYIGDGVIVTDAAGSIEVLNPAAEQLTGWSCLEGRGRGLAEVFPIVHEASGQVIDAAAEAFRRGQPVELEDGVLLARDGRHLPIEGSVSLLHNNGIFIGFAIAFRDISRRRTAELQALAWQRRNLQRQKREALARLAGGVASDFNNMLTIITGYSELLLSGLKSDDPDRNFLAEISHAAERAATVARQLQAFSGGQMMAPAVVDLNQLATRLEKMIRRLAGDGVELLLRLDDDVANVHVDPLQFEQVVLDLVVNACEAMDGSGAITIRSANVRVDEDTLQPDYKVASGPYVMLSVSHTGVAPDDETREHLFEPYFTAGKGERPPGPGLATVYGILKQSGGYIELGSEGLQPTYRIYLPALPASETAPPAAEPANTSLQGSETILVVEDEEAVRGLACKVLRLAGYQVIEALDGSDALLRAQAHHGPIHLVLTDIITTAMSGSDLAKVLHPLRPECRMLFLSGHWGGALVQDGLLEPNALFLQKPFTAEQLLRMVRQALDRPEKK